MLPVIWRRKALNQLENIGKYIAARNPAASDRIVALIEGTAERIPLHPYIHRRGRVTGTREAVAHPNYILVYRVGEDVITIVAVVHARQNYP